MAMTNKLRDISKLYLDTNIFIYFLEGEPHIAKLVERVFQVCGEFDIAVVTSEITVIECMIRPHKQHNKAMIDKYQSFFDGAQDVISILPINSSLVQKIPLVAARFNLKLVDSLHVATAISDGCDGFLSNDHGIGPFDNSMTSLILSDNILAA